jgi:hypothetical protein
MNAVEIYKNQLASTGEIGEEDKKQKFSIRLKDKTKKS